MAQQGQIQFTNLSNTTWFAANFLLFDTYTRALIGDFISSRNTPGIISGCQITVVSGLTISISAGVVLFSNGQIGYVFAQTITLATADPTNPRLDRIELAYSSVPNTQVTNKDGVQVYLDNQVKALGFVNQGTPAATPSAKVTTTGNVTMGVVSVSAGATTLASGNIDQTLDTSRVISASQISSTGAQSRFNEALGVFQISSNGTSWQNVSIDGIYPQKFTVANNQTTALALAGLAIDPTKYVGLKFTVEISILTSSVETFEMGTILASYKAGAGTYDIRFASNFDDSGVVFSINSTGQILYTSSNVAGTSYSGILRITDFKFIAA
jgi:hypothetical protein